jgi:predicted PurR-regulated permease PerM
MKKGLMLVLLVSAFTSLSAQTKEVPYTLEDRDRMIKLETEMTSLRNDMGSLRNEMNSLKNEMNSLRNEMNARFEAVNERIDTLYWGFGILIALMLFLMGYIMWDRRTALNPVQSKTYELNEKYHKLESILKEQAKHDAKLAETLKAAGLL